VSYFLKQVSGRYNKAAYRVHGKLEKSLRLSLVILVWLLISFSLARKVEISTRPDDETSRLELRNITLPNGTESTLYIIQGSPITIKIDEDTITADSIEFDPESSIMRIIGKGKFESKEETVEGENFSVDLGDNSFDAL